MTGIPLAMPALQVQDVEVTAGIEQLEVSWSALPNVDGYKVQWKSGKEDYNDLRQAEITGSDVASYTIIGLTAGIQYTVRVIAKLQDAEDGDPSSEVVGTPKASPPGQVTGVEITVGVEQLGAVLDGGIECRRLQGAVEVRRAGLRRVPRCGGDRR